ncbi:MAG: prolyl oligopeptidase family serine peptidase [Chloroflexia bacterium]
MAKRGVVSLLVETMWSERDWFIKRTQEEDYANSVRQVVELRQAMDILLSEPGVDPSRFAYVGHDFGAMYGTLMGAHDARPRYYVLMAATPRFADWYLYYPKLEGQAREDFKQEMSPLDPITHIPALSPAPLLFQFATHDEHVPEVRAVEFHEAAAQPKEVSWYDAGHELNEEARQDRMAWLSERLGL